VLTAQTDRREKERPGRRNLLPSSIPTALRADGNRLDAECL
jgi:hypothetical protein